MSLTADTLGRATPATATATRSAETRAGATEGRDTLWWVAAFVIGMIGLVLGATALIVGLGDEGDGAAAAPAGETEFDVELGDLYVSPSVIEVPAGETITLHVRNVGNMAHDLKVLGATGTEMLAPGDEQTIVIGPFDTTTEAWCTVPGHREGGMNMTITVLGGSAAAPSAGEHGGMTDGAAGAASDDAVLDPQAAPAADWTARDPELPAAPAGTVHELTLSATETVIEVAPGVRQEVWTFDDQVPGPTLRGKVGDTFRVTVVNNGRYGHSLDFHASMVAWDDEMRTLQPGESLVYEFTAEHAGAFMYHCGTAPALHHIGNGMFGAIIIDPPELAPVDEEFVFVQSEYYFGPQGHPGSLTKMQDEAWDAVVFNGYRSQYVHAPIEVDVDTRYRVWVVDAGPSENSAFHVVGTIFDTVYKEGAYLLQPDEGRGGSQVLDLQPAQGGFVEFTFAEDGLYPFVTHKFANPGKGAIGFFAAGDADLSALGGH